MGLVKKFKLRYNVSREFNADVFPFREKLGLFLMVSGFALFFISVYGIIILDQPLFIVGIIACVVMFFSGIYVVDKSTIPRK